MLSSRSTRMKDGWGRPRPVLDRRLTTLVVTLSISAVQAGCGGSTAGAADHLDLVPHLLAQAELRIGDFEDPDIGFSRVLGMDVDDEGNVYILEGLVPEIRVYSPEGTLLRRIGRKGSGPGEFENPPRFGVLGDTVWTVDNLGNRITLFNREGEVLSTGRQEDLRIPLPSGFGWVLPWLMRPDGSFISHFGRVGASRNDPETGVKPTDSIPVPFVLFDATGHITDTVGWAPRPPPQMWRPPSEASPRPNLIDVGGRRVWVPRPPSTLPWWLPLTDGYVLVETPRANDGGHAVFTVTRIGLPGDTVYHRVLHYSPSRFTSEDLDSIAVRAARGEPGGMAPYIPGEGPPSDWEVVARRLRDEMDFPEFQLPIEYPWLAQDDGLWLRLTDEGSSEQARWILLDAHGRPRGRLELPSDLRIMWSRGDTFWAVDPDEYEVPWVVRFRVSSAG